MARALMAAHYIKPVCLNWVRLVLWFSWKAPSALPTTHRGSCGWWHMRFVGGCWESSCTATGPCGS